MVLKFLQELLVLNDIYRMMCGLCEVLPVLKTISGCTWVVMHVMGIARVEYGLTGRVC
jgi:hypothetical protein